MKLSTLVLNAAVILSLVKCAPVDIPHAAPVPGRVSSVVSSGTEFLKNSWDSLFYLRPSQLRQRLQRITQEPKYFSSPHKSHELGVWLKSTTDAELKEVSTVMAAQGKAQDDWFLLNTFRDAYAKKGLKNKGLENDILKEFKDPLEPYLLNVILKSQQLTMDDIRYLFKQGVAPGDITGSLYYIVQEFAKIRAHSVQLKNIPNFKDIFIRYSTKEPYMKAKDQFVACFLILAKIQNPGLIERLETASLDDLAHIVESYRNTLPNLRDSWIP